MGPTFLLLIVLATARIAVTSTVSVRVESEEGPSSRPMLPAFLGGKPEDEQVGFTIGKSPTTQGCVTIEMALFSRNITHWRGSTTEELPNRFGSDELFTVVPFFHFTTFSARYLALDIVLDVNCDLYQSQLLVEE